MKEIQGYIISTTSFICHIVQLVLLIVFTGAIITAVIYNFGEPSLHPDIPHSLDQIFKETQQSQLIKTLGKKGYRYTILTGSQDSGIFQFLQHYADVRTSKGRKVLVQRNKNTGIDAAEDLMRQTKNYIEDQIDIEPDTKGRREWIFLIEDGEMPTEQIWHILYENPKDRVLIGVTDNSVELYGFKKLEYPPLTLQSLEAIVSKEFQIPEEEARILVKFHRTIPEAFDKLNRITYSHQEYLGNNYYKIDSLSKKELKVLDELCSLGVAQTKLVSEKLTDAGVIVYNERAYWGNRYNILNYQLQKITECKDKIIPKQIQAEIKLNKQKGKRGEKSKKANKKK